MRYFLLIGSDYGIALVILLAFSEKIFLETPQIQLPQTNKKLHYDKNREKHILFWNF